MHSCIDQREFDIFSGGQPIEKIEILKNEADFAISQCRQIVRRKIRSLDPINPALAARELSRHPITPMKVDLPEPEGPVTATYSPAAIDTVTPSRAVTCSPS